MSASLIASAALGAALGIVYFGVLWRSVQRLPLARHPLLWLIGGAVLRIAMLLAAFSVVMDGRWERLVACLAGFIVARFVMVRRLRPQPAARGPASPW